MFEYNEGKIMMINKIIEEIKAERESQDKKWGVQRHHPYLWNTILGEEVGEINKASLDFFNGEGTIAELEAEVIQTAAVCVAYLESIRETKLELYADAMKNSTEAAIIAFKEKHGINKIHIVKIHKNFYDLIVQGFKKWDIRKGNKLFIHEGDHIIYECTESKKPLGLAYVKRRKIFDLVEAGKTDQGEDVNIKRTFKELLASMVMNKYIEDLETEKYVRTNYQNVVRMVGFDVTIIQEIKQ